ncbi:MAG: hydantoinase/oxoprolinase family protein [Actinomycetota bacterium]
MTEPRRYALGVDTGGTYTDAVVYDERAREIIAKAKSPTTHDDLAIGIGTAIDAAVSDATVDPSAIEMVALSTTLATNALVEGTGRPACLVTIGFDADALDRGGLREAIGDDAVIVVDGGHNSHGDEVAPLDLDDLAARIEAIADDVDGFAITAQFATRNADHELAARDLIRERTGKPVTCSHVLSASLGGPKRGVTALLNARLIAMIDDLVATTGAIVADRGIDAPMMIVRGNGSLVSVDFVKERPVETILSGPAASLVGAAHLADADDAVISDIGGTTTDIAVVRGGVPQFGTDGATVGGHRTMVEAVLMHTHGLGGDSEIRLADRAVGAQLEVGPRRVVPLSLMAEEHGDVIRRELEARITDEIPGAFDGMFLQRTARADGAVLDRNEKAVVDAVDAPLVPVSRAVWTGLQERAMRRLVSRAILRLSSFTPTDASHVLGDQTTHDPDVARLGAELFARRPDRYGNDIAETPEEISQAVVAALVRRSAEALLAAALDRDGLDDALAQSPLVAAALDRTSRSARIDIGLGAKLVGLGAPAATYYPAIGELLGSDVEVPGDADVANAIGAVVGKVRARAEIQVTAPRRGVYRIHAGGEPETTWERPEAQARAEEVARAAAIAEVHAAGATEFEVEITWTEKVIDVDGRPMFVEGTATAVAAGRPDLG